MMNKSKNLLPGCLFAIALSALVSMPSPCVAQVADATHSPTLTPAPSRASGSTVTRAEETEVGTADPADDQLHSQLHRQVALQPVARVLQAG